MINSSGIRPALLLICVLIFAGGKVASSAKPILILEDPHNFGNYTAELLKTEGFMEYDQASIQSKELTPDYLKNYDNIIITETKLNPDLKKLFSRYVKEGGNMIFFMPDTLLCDLLGLKYSGINISEGYLKIDSASAIGKGMEVKTIQFHGPASCFKLNGAERIASLYKSEDEDTGYPAVTHYKYGKGQVICFMFNLPESVVYLHQGNPVWKGQERDGVYGLRNLDLFVGKGEEKNWLDKDKVSIPQADEQVRLLTHCLEQLNSINYPMPRLWYFPGLNKCIALLTCDGENNGDPAFYEKEINSELETVKNAGGHMTVYLIGTGIKKETVDSWKNQGHEIGIHYNNTKNAAHPTRENMDSVIEFMQNDFRLKYGYDYPLSTVRNHWIVWYGWSDQAAIEAEHGMHLDCNSYKYDNSKDVSRPDWIGGFGYFTGSGIPMKFANEKGEVIDIYQSETQIVDEQLNTKGGIFNGYKALVDRSLDEEKYAVVNAVFHPNSNSNMPYMDDLKKTVAYCQSRNVPMLTAQDMLEFMQARDSATFENISWTGNKLRFSLQVPVSMKKELTFFVPAGFAGKHISKTLVNQKKVLCTMRFLKGYEYAFISIPSGAKFSIEISYE